MSGQVGHVGNEDERVYVDLEIDGEDSHVLLTLHADGFESRTIELDVAQTLQLSLLLLDGSCHLFLHEREMAECSVCKGPCGNPKGPGGCDCAVCGPHGDHVACAKCCPYRESQP